MGGDRYDEFGDYSDSAVAYCFGIDSRLAHFTKIGGLKVNYYYAEINSNLVANGTIEHTWQWLENVSTVAGAKSAATRRQLFQGTTLLVGILTASDRDVEADPTSVLVKRADALDRAKPGSWRRRTYNYLQAWAGETFF